MGDFRSLEANTRAIPEEKARGDAFERAVLHHVVHDPTVEITEAWLWDEWPGGVGLGRDLGVDIVGTDPESKLVAIQAKFRSDPRRLLRWDDVDSFLAYRPMLFPRRLLVTNALDRNANVRRATEGRDDTEWLFRNDLVASEHWPAVEKRRRPPKPKSPLPYQRKAIRDTVRVLEADDRTQLVMACGTGKTLVTRWITEARDDRLVLVLVPTLLLLKQFRHEWRANIRTDFLGLAVCSDADVVGRDEWAVRSDELGVRVTTDPADIATFLRGRGRRVIFGTYASSARIAEAQALSRVPRFDLVVADEAHRVAGITTKTNKSQRNQRVVLDAKAIRAKSRLFATATPRVYGAATKTRLGEREDIAFASMDDPEHFGIEAHKLWFRRAVELERLVDYRLSVVVVTDAELAELVRERAVLDVQGRRMNAETLASLVALRRAVAELGIERAITFHHTIKRASDFAAELERLDMDAPPVTAAHINGNMSMADRERVLTTLLEPDRPTVVTNARCLTEGIDVPSLDAVAFVDPRSAAVDIVQAVGRVMRISKGKRLGHVIVPVFLSAANLEDPEAAIESTAFAPVLAVLRALRAHDPELVSDATRIATSLGKRDAVVGGHISEHIQLLGHEVDVRGFERALEMRFVEVSKDTWDVWLERLRAFSQMHGHSRPTQRAASDADFDLGRWVTKTRMAYQRGGLSAKRTADLEALPGWSWNPREGNWQKGVQRIQAYVDQAGHARPPASHVSDDGFRLGAWVNAQRTKYRQGKLLPERTATLEAMAGWAWDQPEHDWQDGIAHLRAFADTTGSARPRSGYVSDDGFRLSQWASVQRSEYRQGNLAPARIANLEALPGWTWGQLEDDWQHALAHLRAFVEATGHARPLQSYVTADGFGLGSWVTRQRGSNRQGSLSLGKVADLEALPGWSWDTHVDAWQDGLRHLRACVDETGSARPAAKHVSEDGYRLGNWVSMRRAAFSRGELDPEKIAALEALPGWTWDPGEDRWREAVAQLKALVDETGHARPPLSHVGKDEFRLGQWINGRRTAYMRGQITPEKIAELEALPGWTWDARKPIGPDQQ